MKKQLYFFILLMLPVLGWGQLDGGVYPGQGGHLKVPELTTNQILAIQDPSEGMQAYDKTVHCMKYYNGVSWVCVGSTCCDVENPISMDCHGWKMGDASNNDILSVKSDNNGDLYFLITEGHLKLRKQNKAGLQLWEVSIANSSNNGGYLKLDQNNNPMVAAFGNGYLSPASSPNVASFLVVLNKSSGTVINTLNLAGMVGNNPSQHSGIHFDMDNDGNFIFVTKFSGTTTLGGQTFTTTFVDFVGDKQESLIIKRDPTGNILWVYQIDPTFGGSAGLGYGHQVMDIEIDDNNDIYLSGNGTYTNNTCRIKNSTATHSIPYDKRIYVLKLRASDGVPQWIYSREGNTYLSSNSGPDIVDKPLLKASSDGIYVSGRKYGPINGNNHQYLFIDKLKISNTLTTLYSKEYENQRLETQMAGAASLFVSDAFLNNNGNLYLGGNFGECFIFPTTNLCSNGTLNTSYQDRFILKFKSSNGDFVDGKTFGVTTAIDDFLVLLTINQYGLFAVSPFTGTVNFGSTSLTSSGGKDIGVMHCVN